MTYFRYVRHHDVERYTALGWRESYGVNHEIEFFRTAGKPVFYLDCRTLEMSAEPAKDK